MAIRNFDGATNRIGMGSTGLQVANGAFSIVGVVRPTSLTTGEGFLGLRSSGVMVASLADGGSGKLALYTDTLEASAIVGLTAGDHQIIALTKAAGAVAVRFHRKAVGTGSWTHTSSGGTHPDVAGVVDEVILGGFNPANTSGVKDFDGAVFALFSGLELVDSDIEAIQTFATSQFLYDLGRPWSPAAIPHGISRSPSRRSWCSRSGSPVARETPTRPPASAAPSARQAPAPTSGITSPTPSAPPAWSITGFSTSRTTTRVTPT
jgi:hypothetical protein